MRGNDVSRRSLLMSSAVLGAGVAVGSGPIAAAAEADVMAPVPMPSQVAAKEAMADIPGTRLWYWDTGGDGAPVVLDASGVWQRTDLGLPAAGIGQGRLPRHRLFAARLLQLGGLSPRKSPGSALSICTSRRVSRSHEVSPAGVRRRRHHRVDYAFSHPDRLLSLTIAATPSGCGTARLPQPPTTSGPRGSTTCRSSFASSGPPTARSIPKAPDSGSSSPTRR